MALVAERVSRVVAIAHEERVLLRGFSLRLERGEVFGLTGPSGSGKSTVLRLLVGLDPRSEGFLSLDDKPLEDAELPGFRRRVMLVSQDPPTPLESPRATLSRALEFQTHLGSHKDRVDMTVFEELGLEREVIDRPWSLLSGGERRRVWLGLVDRLHPDYVLLDEPTTGLDRGSTERVALFIKSRAAAGRGHLVVSHDELFLARTADRVSILYDGEVHAEGTPRDVIPAAVAALGGGR